MNYIETIQSAWPDWRIVDEEPLGTGSFGCVYRAQRRDITGVAQAAIKIISIPKDRAELNALRREGMSFEETRTYLEKMVRSVGAEIRLMEQVKGFTNIVSIEDYKVIEHSEIPQWQILIRMELLSPLPAVMSEAEVIRLGKDICSALAICQKKNIVHRDIKPENIFINNAGFYKLGDFGVARTMEHMTVGFTRTGTYNYMAPEVFNNEIKSADIDAAMRVDIYSLGMVLYTLCNNGRIPFLPVDGAVDPDERIRAISRRMKGEALPAPRCASAELTAIIRKACSFNPQDRYANAEIFRDALENIGVNTGTVRMSEDASYKSSKPDYEPNHDQSSTERTEISESSPKSPIQKTKAAIAESSCDAKKVSEQGVNESAKGHFGHIPEAYTQASSTLETNASQKKPVSHEESFQQTSEPCRQGDVKPAGESSQQKPRKRSPKTIIFLITICITCLAVAIYVFLQTENTSDQNYLEISDSWEEIIAAIDTGTAKQRYSVGMTKELDLGDLGMVHMQLAGFELDDRAYGQGKAATTWIAMELLSERQNMNSNWDSSGGWRNSNLRYWLQNTVLPAIPKCIHENLITVKKNQNTYKNGLSESQTTEEIIWIPDLEEIFGSNALYNDLFKNDKKNQIKRYNNHASWWWLRSESSIHTFNYVTTNGDHGFTDKSSNGGVAIGFCLGDSASTFAYSPELTETNQYETLSKGIKNDSVLALQTRLIELGFLSGKADGDFGNKTQTAVKVFQEYAGLEVTGIADSTTQAILFSNNAPNTEFSQVTKPENNSPQTGEISESWEEIIAHIDDGTAQQRYAVGATKALDLGEFGTIHMQLAGFDLDVRVDGYGKAATTWIAIELLSEKKVMNHKGTSEGGWRDSDLRAWLQNDVLPTIPDDVRQRLLIVEKTQTQYKWSLWEDTKDSLWIPDYNEVFGVDALYDDLFRDNNENRIKRFRGTDAWWWLRSANSYDYFMSVSTSGNYTCYSASGSGGVVLGFCL